MGDEITRTVEVGGEAYTIGRFRALKATQILKASGAIGRQYPEIAELVAGFERQYAEQNAVVLSRAEAEFRFGEGARSISEEAWEADGQKLALKKKPSERETLAVAFTQVLEAAQDQFLEMLAMATITNQEFEEHDDADDLPAFVAERAKILLRQGYLDELVELALAAYEVGREQLAPVQEDLGKLLALMGLGRSGGTPTPTSAPASGEQESPSPRPPSDSETRSSSSTDSPRPSAGTEPQPSEPRGDRSSVSAPA